MNFNSRGFIPQVTTKTAAAKHTLTKLNRFRNLNSRCKRYLYTTTVRSALLYPTIPLNTISKNQLKKLQVVQNRATRFITGHKKSDRLKSAILHELSQLDPINTHLHISARNMWQNIEINNPEIYNQLQFPPDYNHRSNRFPSSKIKALAPDPAPMFT